MRRRGGWMVAIGGRAVVIAGSGGVVAVWAGGVVVGGALVAHVLAAMVLVLHWLIFLRLLRQGSHGDNLINVHVLRPWF